MFGFNKKENTNLKEQEEFKLYEDLRKSYLRMAIELSATDLVASKEYLKAAKDTQSAFNDYVDKGVALYSLANSFISDQN